MANEVNMTVIMNVRNGHIDYTNQPTGFEADQDTAGGPTPGYITATTTGTTVDLSELTTAAMCMIQNVDPTNFVEVGVYSGGTFYPLAEILPGEMYPLRLSRNLAALRIKADTASCGCIVEAFEA